MCSECDRRRAPARGECGWPATDVRLPRLLSAVHRLPGRAALPRGAGPLSGISRISRWTAAPGRHCRSRSASPSSSPTPPSGAPSPSTPARPGRPNPSWIWTPGTPSARADPRVGLLADDVEALLVRVPESARIGQPQSYLVPIDACYEFVGRLRMLWRGFDGGQEAREFIDGFFAADRGPRRGDADDRPADGRQLRGSRRGARTVHRQPGADRPRRRRRRRRRPRARHRAALPGPHRAAATRPTPTTKRPG